jgi:hypothetical protein
MGQSYTDALCLISHQNKITGRCGFRFKGTGQFFPRRLRSRYEARTNCVPQMKLRAWCGTVKATAPLPIAKSNIGAGSTAVRRNLYNRNAIEIQGQ